MFSRFFSLFFVCVALAACAQQQAPKHSSPNRDKAANIALSESAIAVSHDLNTVAANEQATNTSPVPVPPNPASYGMNIAASLNWQGPIEPPLKQLTEMTNYHLRILGNPPSVPIMVNINVTNEMVGTIIRDLGLQAKHRAQIVIIPSRKVVELRYLGNQ